MSFDSESPEELHIRLPESIEVRHEEEDRSVDPHQLLLSFQVYSRFGDVRVHGLQSGPSDFVHAD